MQSGGVAFLGQIQSSLLRTHTQCHFKQIENQSKWRAFQFKSEFLELFKNFGEFLNSFCKNNSTFLAFYKIKKKQLFLKSFFHFSTYSFIFYFIKFIFHRQNFTFHRQFFFRQRKKELVEQMAWKKVTYRNPFCL